jgi:thiamine biosynthesis lipoprotein
VILDFGGHVAVGGDCGPQQIPISKPDNRHLQIAELRLFEGSVATSGLSERGMIVDGVRYGHILDPSSGSPAPDWGTVTVVAADPFAADCLATALYVMGPIRGAEWLIGNTEIEAVFVQRYEMRIDLTATPGLMGRLEHAEGKVRYLPLNQQRMTIQSP